MLPEKWAVAITYATKPLILEFLKKEADVDRYNNLDDPFFKYFNWPNSYNENGYLEYHHLEDKPKKGHTEITVEQFVNEALNKQESFISSGEYQIF